MLDYFQYRVIYIPFISRQDYSLCTQDRQVEWDLMSKIRFHLLFSVLPPSVTIFSSSSLLYPPPFSSNHHCPPFSIPPSLSFINLNAPSITTFLCTSPTTSTLPHYFHSPPPHHLKPQVNTQLNWSTFMTRNYTNLYQQNRHEKKRRETHNTQEINELLEFL